MIVDRRLVLAGLGASALPAVANAASRWTACAPVPWPIQEVYGTAWRGKAVIAGGLAADPAAPRTLIVSDRLGIYDPKTDNWTEGPKLPFARHHPSVASALDRVYVMGGYRQTPQGDWNSVNDVLVFDGKGWSPGPALPSGQCEAVSATLGDHIHVYSGRSPNGPAAKDWTDQIDTGRHLVLDAKAGRWTQAAPSPSPRDSAGGGAIDGKLYLVGGRAGGRGAIVNSAELNCYDPKTDKWVTLAPMPAPAGGIGAAALGGKLYAFGGEIPGVHPQAWSYDPQTDRWSAEPDMRTPRHGVAGMAVDGKVFAIGGGEKPSGGQTSQACEALII
jgi:N-acetylneuraminic acid mutarotase